MKTNLHSSFAYRFRSPGSGISGPVGYAIGQSTQGLVLAGRSRDGICAIFLGEDAAELRAQLSRAFPRLALSEDAGALSGDLNQIIAFLDKGASDELIELDIGGTAFQQKVWRALCAIPAGQTRSYTELAQSLSVPRAVRAVGGACAANVLAIAIPCHRIVRSDGSISGYRWGVERKRALLAQEGA